MALAPSQGLAKRKFLAGRDEIVNMYRFAINEGTAGNPVACYRQNRSIHIQRNGTIVRLDGEPIRLWKQDNGIVGVAEACSTFGHHLQNWLDVGRRASNHPQDLARRS